MSPLRAFFVLCVLVPTLALAKAPAKTDAMRDAQGAIDRAVNEGFDNEKEIVERVLDVYDGDLSAQQKTAIPAAVKKALASRKAEEQKWTTPTDVDRLEAAFAALDQAGVFARIRFSDCQTCALGEMKTELEKPENARYRGFVYCHDQDVEGAAEPGAGGLFLGYGPRPGGGEKDMLAVADEVVAMLKRAKLKVVWDHSLERRIMVALRWQKRRFTKSPPVTLAP